MHTKSSNNLFIVDSTCIRKLEFFKFRHSYYIVLSRSKGLSCFMQFAKEWNYFRVICLFFWQFMTSKRRSRSQDWIILFLLSFYLRILFHAMFFISCLFYPNKILLIADCANLKILKAKVKSFFGTVLLELLNDAIFFHQNIL